MQLLSLKQLPPLPVSADGSKSRYDMTIRCAKRTTRLVAALVRTNSSLRAFSNLQDSFMRLDTPTGNVKRGRFGVFAKGPDRIERQLRPGPGSKRWQLF